jgi:hypothetical protein
MKQVGGVHSLTLTNFCAKVKKLIKNAIFADIQPQIAQN